jgi:hypothetical protein
MPRILGRRKTLWIRTPGQKWHKKDPYSNLTMCGVTTTVYWSLVTTKEPPADADICKWPQCERR